MIGLIVVLLTYFWMVSNVLLLWGVDADLGDGYGGLACIIVSREGRGRVYFSLVFNSF